MGELCAYVNDPENRDPIHLAAYVMWRLNWVHPFEEGNGRSARAASYLVLSVGLGKELPGETTIIERCVAERKRYIAALESADRAWKSGTLDLGALEKFLDELLTAQLEEHLKT